MIAALLVRLPALAGGLVWDDILILKGQLGAFRSVHDLLLPPAGIPQFSVHYYRPLTIASYLLDRALFGDRPWGFHLSVLLVHAAVAALVYLLAASFLAPGPGRRPVCLCVSLLFAAHPIHTESVAWIAGRGDVLAALLVLAAALVLRSRPTTVPALAAALGLFAGACLAKEVAFAFVPLVPLFMMEPDSGRRSGRDAGAKVRGGPAPGARDVSRCDSSERTGGRAALTRVTVTIAFAVAAVCIVALRAAALGGIGADAPRAGGALAPIESAGGALAFYLPRAVVPLPASPYVDRVAGGLSAWAGLGAAIAIAFFGAILVLRGGRMSAQARAADRAGGGSSARGAGSAMDCASADRLAGTGLVSFLLFLIPSLGPAVMKVSTVPVAERYLYLPTAMLALAAAGGLARLLAVRPRWGRAALAATAAAALVLGAVSFGRTRIWKDDLSLWRSAVTTTDAAPPRIYLATALVESERLDEAESIYAGLLSGPGPLDARQRALATMNLGIVRRMRGDDEGALLRFEEAARLDPAAPLAWYNLATTLWETALLDPAKGTADAAKVSRALDAIQRARALSPLDPKILLFLGQAQATLGQRSEARASLERAAQLDPGGVVGSQARLILARLGPED